MGHYVGWDIGGVHLKRSRLDDSGAIRVVGTRVEPFEIWKDPAALAARLRALAADLPPAIHGVTMTAELSDTFDGKRAGVRAILDACAAALPGPPRVLTVEGGFVDPAGARARPLDVAAANWRATATLAARARGAALLIDAGSTTTDIIPLRDGRPVPRGTSDTDRLLSGELVYSGAQRTPPASLTEAVPLGGSWCRIASEHFAIMADVYRVLGFIAEAQYTVPTPDGRGRDRAACEARLARLVCADPDQLPSGAIAAIAAFLHDRQTLLIARAVRQVIAAAGAGASPPGGVAIVAGAGRFLAEAAAARAGMRSLRLARAFPEIRGAEWDSAAPSAAIAVLLAEEAAADAASGSATSPS